MYSKQTFLSSVLNALNGLFFFITKERNARIQLTAAAVAVTASVLLRISAMQWIIVLTCIGAVLCLEMVNTSVEKLCDVVHKEYHPEIRWVKDIAAAAVLLAALVSVIAGAIIFIPKMLSLI
ncbi:diacylglycerol kinase (ATP) [Filimonas lacunae]|uniref:Diacylglycerol kinase (ATP) n=1 Tax=Filimonas lacunae TaxID=477680 RepID=A0A173MB97_9BACT|nr:diacylglycerol kinase family protein [Filimonas lacunae]BAV04825.1 diacylglycerol kinase [Filimonas lacunae]SIT34704.1 diacylglycerol kinase (ATP) [Filimonas lacunae]